MAKKPIELYAYDLDLILASLELTVDAWKNWIDQDEYPEGWNKKTSKEMVAALKKTRKKIKKLLETVDE